VLEFRGSRIGDFVLAFNEGADDVRESSGFSLTKDGWPKVNRAVFTTRIRLDLIYGSNRQFVVKRIVA